MYGKHFESMYKGSMMGSGLNVYAVWGYAISNCMDSMVELHPKALALILGGDQKIIEEAITFLCEPDPDSRHKDCDGRRLVHENAYYYSIPSYEYYSGIATEKARRDHNRKRQAEFRARKKREKESSVT